ncbi:hypothetical protein TrLO_g108 [Triparma laevis f. longispina]|uniref:Glycoside hydrolase family 3 C-terminal domain-containing protein n=1 Tax=Triparma laevis f. longispina TaxID=1714387 RepID=A0A9W7C7Q0_9STRA|nr:hypothetical protein TrLO_g108 [Triparma laevis f. longispina]
MQTESDVDNTPLTIATSKHFFVYNLDSDFAAGGDDPQARLKINVNVTDADLRQTYLRIFKKTTSPHFTKSPARSVMCSYNAINGIPAYAHPMLQEYLRDELAFPGFIVSDEGAIQWMGEGYHEYTSSDAESAKSSMKRSRRLSPTCSRLESSLECWTLFDSVSWSDLSAENAVDTAESRALARALAGESLVLLKNENNVLPLKTTTKKVALLGPNANRTETLLSNHAGCKANPNDQTIDPSCTLVNPLDGLKAMAMKDGFEVTYEQGVDIDTNRTDGIDAAVKLASEADVAVIVVGLITCQETGDQCQEAEALDRTSITLPGLQETLVEQVANTGTPTVVIIMSGGTVSVPSLAKSDSVDAIIQSFYGGEELGSAMADMLFGKINPSGRLPATIFEKLEDLPADYLSMEMLDAPGRTGRYFKGEPLYAFGFGSTKLSNKSSCGLP